MKVEQSFRHQFLLAMPGLADGNFGGTITYLCDHDEHGAMGLVINRPGTLSLIELLAELHIEGDRSAADISVLVGGPVTPERGFVLHSDEHREEDSIVAGPGLLLSASRGLLEAIASGRGPKRFLVALGYAGWGPGQLEQEMAENAWLSCPANLEVIFDTPFEERVMRAAEALGIDFRRLSSQAGHA